MMDDIAEQQDVAKEISEAISNPGKFVLIVHIMPVAKGADIFYKTTGGMNKYLYLLFL